jgi:hypothetical protein
MSEERKGYSARLEVTGPDGETYTVTGLVAESLAIEVKRGDPYDAWPPVMRNAPVELVRFDFVNPVEAEDGTVYTLTEKKEALSGN